MKKLAVLLYSFLFTVIFSASPLVTSPSIAAVNPAAGGSLVGAKVDYTGLWRGTDGKNPGIDAGTVDVVHPTWLCTPTGFQFKLLCGPAVASFLAMNEAFKKRFGHNMPVGGGYRTKASQLSGGGTFATYKPNYTPPAHLWGTAIDFDTGVYKNGTEEQTWTVQNGPTYGWFWPNWAKQGQGGTAGVVEPWHFNYYFIGHNPASDDLEDLKGYGPGGGNGNGGISTATACTITKVGNPAGQPVLPAGCEDANTGTGIIKVAHDLKNTLDKCTGGSTLLSKNNDTCTKADLKSKGYTDKQIQAYITRRNSSADNIGVECLGWVSNVVALSGGVVGASFGAGWAGDLIDRPELSFSPYTFTKVSTPQPGDVGATRVDGHGHVLIVNKLQGASSFVGIEANWTPYTVTENKVHPNSRYTFFRKK